LDKLIGEAFRSQKLPLQKSILLLSGRASFELIQKATMAGIGTIVSVGAPSSLALDLARENGQTLIGFLKESSYNEYS
jgi:FdhD protein